MTPARRRLQEPGEVARTIDSIRESASGLSPSNRSTRIGCVFEALTSPHPSGRMTLTPSVSTMSNLSL